MAGGWTERGVLLMAAGEQQEEGHQGQDRPFKGHTPWDPLLPTRTPPSNSPLNYVLTNGLLIIVEVSTLVI